MQTGTLEVPIQHSVSGGRPDAKEKTQPCYQGKDDVKSWTSSELVLNIVQEIEREEIRREAGSGKEGH